MDSAKRFPYDLNLLAEAFNLNVSIECQVLTEWLTTTYTLSQHELISLNYLHELVKVDGKYWNEEELKIRFIGGLFAIAQIDVPDKIKVFYERPLSATINNHHLAVIADCLVATPLKFNAPRNPYFFLQEYKKGRGDRATDRAKDPEAQMLMAMLIAQEKNGDGYPLYGSYVIGSTCYFCTLQDNNYCSSRLYDASDRNDLLRIIYTLRKLKDLILNR